MTTTDAFSPADIDWHPIDPRWITLKRLHMAIGWGVLVVAAVSPLAGTFVATHRMASGWLLWSCLGVAAVLLATLAYRLTRAPRLWRAWGYAERGEDLCIRHGIWWRRLTVVPYGRMQMVNVEAGPLERSLGLAHVTLVTAAAMTDAVVAGLAQADADRLRAQLVAKGDLGSGGL